MTMIDPDDDFEIASRAFNLFTSGERKKALEKFAQLRYQSVTDRFFEAVHFVIVSKTGGDTRSCSGQTGIR
jgi:hypothetical protein